MQVKETRFRYTLVSIAIAMAVGGAAAWVNAGKFDTPGLVTPPLTPPPWLFPIIWTLLYVLMGISAARVWASDAPGRSDALFVYGTQLVVGFLWTVFYFSFGAVTLSFFWLLFQILLVILMIVRFEQISPGAGRLQIPYLLWLLFAAYLNLMSWLLNR